ncbi:MAG TPA: 23S rRNA (pseudouridine(1915)-N(3))-methyltransferase RlmH, partial [Terriglobia bacterium]|nr:23S rRNA (pseudouridine(1915)-N(3))-methyltransferase RlmH [Terriglobia bacterium]
MKLRVVWIGKTRSKELSALIDDFLERLRRFVPVEVTELRDPRSGDDQRQLAAEEERLLVALDSGDRVVVLDVEGQTWSSKQFSQFLDKHLRS